MSDEPRPDFASVSFGPVGGETAFLVGTWTGRKLRIYRSRVLPLDDERTHVSYVRRYLKKQLDELLQMSDQVCLSVDVTRASPVICDLLRSEGFDFPSIVAEPEIRVEQQLTEDLVAVPEGDLAIIPRLAKQAGNLTVQRADEQMGELQDMAYSGNGDFSSPLWLAFVTLCWHARAKSASNQFNLY